MHQSLTKMGGVAQKLPAHDPLNPIMWEAGHYYLAKGPTQWSEAGWTVMNLLAHDGDSRMLFVDDVHQKEDVHMNERDLARIAFDPKPQPTHMAVESEMLVHAYQALEMLKQLPRRHRARNTQGRWYCSGFPLQGQRGQPLCLLFDLGLTWYKRKLGFQRAINVVPLHYAEEQRQLMRLVRKAMPSFELAVITHDLHGNWQHLD